MTSAPAISPSTMRSAGSRTISTRGAFDLAFTLQVGSRPDPAIQFSADHLLAVGCTKVWVSLADERIERLERRVEVLLAKIEEQAAKIEEQAARIGVLESENAELRRRLGENSSNLSKPPSSDAPKDRAARPGAPSSGKNRGGQPGHKGSKRTLLPPSKVDSIDNH